MASERIINCAVTGAIHVPSQTPYLPITPAQIAADAIAAAGAGAATVHLHARHPDTGQPSSDPELFADFCGRIAAQSDVVIGITTGGGLGMSPEQRLAAVQRLQPELASLNMGSINFGLFPMKDRIASFQHEWEAEYLEMTRDFVFRNTFRDCDRMLRLLRDAGTKPELECYDIGHLYNTAHFVDQGLLEPPFWFQFIMGVLGGIGPSVENLLHFKNTADRLFGSDYVWSVLAAGKHEMTLGTVGAVLGGAVRVGLEDNLYLARGVLARSNADLVAKMQRILTELGLQAATPEQARQVLKLKGRDQTRF
jgi:uncharacterized protein (DUF849 family)